MDSLDIGVVAQLASELQRRLDRLTSAWTAAQADLHRLQETVSRAYVVLQDIALSEPETTLDVSSGARDSRSVHEQLSGHLSLVRKSLEDLVDILVFVHPHSHRSAAGFSKRWILRREEVASLRLRLKDGIHHFLRQLSLLKITVSADSQDEAQDVAESRRYNSAVETSTVQAEPTEPLFSKGRAARITGHEPLMEAEFALKYRDIAFEKTSHGAEIVHENWLLDRVGEEPRPLIREYPDFRGITAEPKVLSSTAPEPKSRDTLRGKRIHANVLGEQPVQRSPENEKEFQHLERIFQVVSPFRPQGVGAVSPHHELGYVSKASPRSRNDSQARPSFRQEIRDSGHLARREESFQRQQRCPSSCLCSCHSQVHVGSGSLSAFNSTLGSFTFIFSTGTSSCDTSSCVASRGQYLQIMYAFPQWLFHAAISATLKDWTMGSPELLLRVHRRIDPGMMAIYTSVFSLITRGDIEGLKRALARREASVYDVAGRAGVSTLYHALRLRQMDCVELLLCEGADVFQLDDAGLGPYHEAIQVMYTSANAPFQDRLHSILPMQQILEAGQLTILHKIAMGILWASVSEYVASHGYADVNTGDSNSHTPLYYASARGNTAIVQDLLDAGAYPDAIPQTPSLLAPAALQSWTPLCTAARNGHLDVVKRLIEAGAEVNKRSKHNRTALHECAPTRGDYSMHDSSLEIAACLLAHGADFEVVDSYGSTILDSACIRDHARLASFFVEQGVDTTHRDWEGSNALDNCIAFNSLRCTVLLLGLGPVRSGIRNVDDNGSSTLHYLATSGSVQVLELFAESGLCGLDPELKDSQGKTALEVFNDRASVADELRETFSRCLHMLLRPETVVSESQNSDDGSDTSEFFDAEGF